MQLLHDPCQTGVSMASQQPCTPSHDSCHQALHSANRPCLLQLSGLLQLSQSFHAQLQHAVSPWDFPLSPFITSVHHHQASSSPIADSAVPGVQRLYARSAREVRRLETIAKSPIYSSFGEVLQGAPVIRGCGAQARMAARNFAHLAQLQRADLTGV